LERAGYQRTDGGDARLWYLYPAGNASVQRYTVLEPKPKLRIFAVNFGFSNEDVRGLRNRIAKQVVSELGKVSRETLCWTTFDVGRALQWPLLGIPYPRDAVTARNQLTEMCQYLGTQLELVRGPAEVSHRLTSSDAPFGWMSLNHPVRRAVEAVAATRVSGQDLAEVKRRLLGVQPTLYQALRVGPRWPRTVEMICRAADET
jgi:hypothetical protein